MIIYFASGNAHKKHEMEKICAPHTIKIPADDGIDFNPEETGTTFIENALIKAKALWEIVKQPVLADDSGICVEILGGIPGVYSARYEGKEYPKGQVNKNSNLSQMQQNALLLEHVNSEAAKNGKENRNCHYVCAMVLYLGEDRFYCIQETFSGVLVSSIENACGKGGFGYDPVVLLPNKNKSVAELSEEEKNAISHRGKATRKILSLLRELEKENAN